MRKATSAMTRWPTSQVAWLPGEPVAPQTPAPVTIGIDVPSVFWLGAHKTGTTFLQKSLGQSQDVLQQYGVHYMELDDFREKYGRPVLNENGGQPAPTEFTTPARVDLVFDENIPGYVQHALQRRGFYPEMEVRTSAIANHLGLTPTDVVFGLRNYVGYLPSLYCETLKSTPFRTFDDWMAKSFRLSPGTERANWHDLLRRLVTAHPQARVRTYFAEDLPGNEAQLLEAILGIPASSFTMLTSSERLGFSADAVKRLHDINDEREVTHEDVRTAVRELPKSAGRPGFAPFDDAQRAALHDQYQQHKQAIIEDPDIEVVKLG